MPSELHDELAKIGAAWLKREAGGIGLYRFFICPTGLIAADELPARWACCTSTGSALPKSPDRGGTSGLTRKRILLAGQSGSTRRTTMQNAACCSRYLADFRWASPSRSEQDGKGTATPYAPKKHAGA